MAISIGDLEEAAALGWRAPDEASLGGWRLRAAEGFTGRAITAALAAAAEARGAAGLYLQVENHNAAARRLYERAGFAAHHEYHYRVAG